RAMVLLRVFFFQAEDGIRDFHVTGVQTCALPISVVAATFAAHGTVVGLAEPTGITRPMTGQTICGDALAVRHDDGVPSLLVADGLGHGPLAAVASDAAVRAFLDAPSGPPVALLERVHAALGGTRGA